MQSGGCTNVLNSSLVGIIDEASKSGAFDHIFGASLGLEGFFRDEVIDLSDVPQQTLNRIARAPGAALGSTRRRLTEDDLPVVFERLAGRNITHWFIAGGNDSAATGHTLTGEARPRASPRAGSPGPASEPGAGGGPPSRRASRSPCGYCQPCC